MPRRPPPEDDPEILASIKEALRHPLFPTAEEEVELLAMRERARITRSPERVAVKWSKRKGRQVYRVEGRVGADLDEHPATRRAKLAERDYLATLEKLRGPPSALGVAARQQKATENIARIRLALAQHAHRGRSAVGIVARELGFTSKHIRAVKNKRT